MVWKISLRELQHCNAATTEKIQKKVGKTFEDRNEIFVPLHCRMKEGTDADGECEKCCRPTKKFYLASQQKPSP